MHAAEKSLRRGCCSGALLSPLLAFRKILWFSAWEMG